MKYLHVYSMNWKVAVKEHCYWCLKCKIISMFIDTEMVVIKSLSVLKHMFV